MAPEVQRLNDEHLPQVQALVNAHLGAVVPGWALPAAFIAERLRSDPGQFVIGPWVVERASFCGVDGGRVTAVAHVLRYGDGPEVGPYYRGAADIAWFLAWPEAREAGRLVLAACQGQMASWRATVAYAWDTGLPVPVCVGVPDAWPHVAEALREAGYAPNPERDEVVFGGTLEQVPSPGGPPVAGVELRRVAKDTATAFIASLDGAQIGYCGCVPDLALGGELPALAGWGELSDVLVEGDYRNRGIGGWLVRHAVVWLRLAGCDRIVLSVAAGDEAAGAGRFYRRFGWDALVRQEGGWARGRPALNA